MIKRLSNLLLCLVLAISMAVPVCGANKKTIEKEPVVISTPEELLALAEACRLDTYSEALTVTLAADIDLSGMDVAPIPVFAGIFDGGGHCITGLQLAKQGSVQGLFRYLTKTAVVRNLTIEVQIVPEGSRGSVGGIAGSQSV